MIRLKSIFITLGITALPFTVAANKLTGTPISSSYTQTAAQRAFDGDSNSYYIASSPSYSWVGLDLGSKHVINKIGWIKGANVSESQIRLGVFQGANKPDFSDAIPIAIIDDVTKNETAVNCSRGFQYVRYVGPSESFAKIAEIEFYGEIGEGDDSHLWQITNLPTVSINTVNGELPYDKETYISSTFILISDNGSKVLEKIETGIRERGNASREFPKKPYKIKFDKKQNILDAPAKAKKWTLINNYGDKSLMRNMLAFDVARMFQMEWVPFCAPVDVVVNGEYKGCYQLCDQVEVNDNRLEIDEMTPDDISGDALTGGYFVEIDAYAYDEPVWFRTDHYGLPITIKSPDEDVIVEIQKNYIRNYFNKLESLMKDTNPLTGYRTMFDNRSFIQHMLVNEVAGNTDAYWSTNMYKRRNDPKIYTGPVWDFDLGFNNDNRTYPVQTRSGNVFLWNSGLASSAEGMLYFAQRILDKDPSTKEEIFDVWKDARNNGLDAQWLQNKVEEYADLLYSSQRLNFMRWPILSEFVHQNPKIYGSYEGECDAIIQYINARMKNLDRIIGYDPEVNNVENIYQDNKNYDAIYYTVTGHRVEVPTQPGIYIEVKGTQSRKIFVK